MQYFEIRCGENDGIIIRKVTPNEKYFNEMIEDENEPEFLDDFPQDRWSGKRDKLYMENQPECYEVILIRGEIVVPKKKEVVTKFEI